MMKSIPTAASRISGMTTRRSVALLMCWTLALLSLMQSQSAPTFPKIEGESLAGHDVVLPAASAGKVAVLIFGFSKASKNPTGAWARKLHEDFGNQPEFELYQLPVLEDVPWPFRKMVISGMRSNIPENQRDHFVPILRGEADLQKLVSFKEPDDAYLVLLDRSGRIARQSHGPFEESTHSQLREQIRALLDSRN